MRRYKAKRVKTRSLQEWVGHFEPKFQGEGVVPGEYVLVSTKLDTFCYPKCKLHRATCRRFGTIPACDGQTDGQMEGRTDGIAVANTALAMRALRRAVKTVRTQSLCLTASKQKKSKFPVRKAVLLIAHVFRYLEKRPCFFCLLSFR